MLSTLVIVSVLEVVAVALVITGFIFEKKVIAFEEKLEDKIAVRIGRFLLSNKYTKDLFVKKQPSTQSRARSVEKRCPETSTPNPGGKRSSRVA